MVSAVRGGCRGRWWRNGKTEGRGRNFLIFLGNCEVKYNGMLKTTLRELIKKELKPFENNQKNNETKLIMETVLYLANVSSNTWNNTSL